MVALNSLLSVLLFSQTLSSPVNHTGGHHAHPNLHEQSHDKDAGQPLILTPYIESGDIDKARSLSRVGKLPRVPAQVPSYSGFFTVNKEHDSNMFFWFFPAMNNDTKAPVILWLQGGPGSSGLLGVFALHGPYVVRKNVSVGLRSHTWSKEFNVIYVDNPVGAGFSFTKDEDGYSKDQEHVAENLYEFLRQFFKVFYEYSSHDFYIVGHSYAGKYIPAIAYKIHVDGPPAQITFKGIGIGNGFCDPETQMNYSDYFYQLGLIDWKQAEVVRRATEKTVRHIRNGQFLEALVDFNSILQVFPTDAKPSYLLQFAGYNYTSNFLQTEDPESLSYFRKYIILPQFRRALHVGNLTFSRLDKVRDHLIPDIMRSVKPQLVTIMDNNYKVLLYNGQMDLIAPYVLMVDLLSKAQWKLKDEFRNAERRIWKLDGTEEVAGYVHNVGDFYQVLMRNAGHMTPYEQPEYSLDMITRFIKGRPFA